MVVLLPPPNMFSLPYPPFHSCITSTPKHVFPALSTLSWLCYLHPQTCFPCPIHPQTCFPCPIHPFMVVLPPPPNMFSLPYPPFHSCVTSTPNMFSQPYPSFHGCVTSTPKHVFPALSIISWLCYLHPQTCFPSPIHPFIVVLPPPPNMFSLPYPSFHGCVTSTPKHVFPALSIISWLCYLHPKHVFPALSTLS